jgi:hypothetical protein
MESLREKAQDRKPYESPAVVYETLLEVRAVTSVSTNPGPPNDLFGLSGDK